MALEAKHIIHTEADGVLGDTKPGDVHAAVAAIAAAGQGVLHFHGGLVNKGAGLEIATRLRSEYEDAGAHPVFFVWEAGFLETISGNLADIFREDIFERILEKLLKWVVGDVITPPGTKALGGLGFPSDNELYDELEKRETPDAGEPYGHLDVPPDLDEITEAMEQEFANELSADAAFQSAAGALARTALDESRTTTTSRGLAATQQKSTETLMSPYIVDEVVADTDAGSKGLFSAAKLVVRAGKVLTRVVKRLRSGRGHGIYTTIVEEILREFYVANIGAEIWLMMKKDTADTFDAVPAAGDRRGGELFLEELGALAAAGTPIEIDLVGHSTGAVFICNLLAAADHAAADPNHPLPLDFAFRNVIFLAPACTHRLLADTLESHRDRFGELRMFTMNDEREAEDRLLPGPLAAFYPRSMLYFVSGVVERRPDGESAFDRPLVGMERYLTDANTYTADDVAAVRGFFDADEDRTVFAPATGAAGKECDATKHGDLDNDAKTIASLRHMIANGF